METLLRWRVKIVDEGFDFPTCCLAKYLFLNTYINFALRFMIKFEFHVCDIQIGPLSTHCVTSTCVHFPSHISIAFFP